MAQQIVTIEDLQQFRLQLLEDLKVLIQPANNPSQKEWLKSSDVRKMLGISHGTLQNLRIKGVLPYRRTRSWAASCSNGTRTLPGCLMVIRSRKGSRIGTALGRGTL